MKLSEILNNINSEIVNFNKDIEITSIQNNSSKITEGSIFLAIRGNSFNGADFIENAIKYWILSCNDFALELPNTIVFSGKSQNISIEYLSCIPSPATILTFLSITLNSGICNASYTGWNAVVWVDLVL